MDIPVQITMIVLFVLFVIAFIGMAINAKRFIDCAVAILFILIASFIGYGLHIQCDNMAVFYRCGG